MLDLFRGEERSQQILKERPDFCPGGERGGHSFEGLLKSLVETRCLIGSASGETGGTKRGDSVAC